MKYSLKELEEFLFRANANGYAGEKNGRNVFLPPQRPGFEELEYKEGDWLYHDSYAGHFFAPGQEVVYYKNKPVWTMAYAGGMKFEYHGDAVCGRNANLTDQTFEFLKKALLAMDPAKPFRGPEKFEEGNMRYESSISGDIKDFTGNEKIYIDNKLVFEQNFIGGVIVGR